MSQQKDKLYAKTRDQVGRFKFDDKVASVFSDMISRSVPSYQPILSMLPTITREFRQNGANYYDLGCSLGAGLHAMSEGLKDTIGLDDISGNLIGIDTSRAMIERAKDYRCPYSNLSVIFTEANILDSAVNNAAMVLLNFTLQFLPLESRENLLGKVYDGLNPGGALILSEKICYEDAATDSKMIDIHHRYKADQGYSQLEISQKRDAIENVLIPETLETHINRLSQVGFSIVTPWHQNLQFISILAIKG
ncbi:MAG: carboxy-S-adenosyl-L-methionine synthase CmoA [Gammaproteobacteria bacterium]|nr:carboxy-S-adenosyl-L-methionine synthase CmoA [Gammaproteobacteria bacterium]